MFDHIGVLGLRVAMLIFERARTLCFRWRGTNLGILDWRTRLKSRHFEFAVSFEALKFISIHRNFARQKNATLPLSAPPFVTSQGAHTRLSEPLHIRQLYESKIMPIQTLSADMQSMGLDDGGIEPAPFPAATKQAAGLVNGVQTDVSSVYFADKILITISQGGRLSQWVRLTILF